MEKNIKKAVLTLLSFAVSVSLFAQDANTILKKLDQVMYSPKDMQAKNSIILIDKNGKQEVREADVIQKGTDKRLMRFTSPASQKGIAVLSLPNDVMYLYLPAFGKERRISSSVKNQNFAGTDFSYYDMEAKPFTEKFGAKMINQEANAYVLELTPKTNSDYSKIIAKIHKTNYYPLSMEYYDKGNNKIKTAKYTFKKIGNYWNASEIEMKDLRKNHTTKMKMTEVKYDQGLSDDKFTVRALKQ